MNNWTNELIATLTFKPPPPDFKEKTRLHAAKPQTPQTPSNLELGASLKFDVSAPVPDFISAVAPNRT